MNSLTNITKKAFSLLLLALVTTFQSVMAENKVYIGDFSIVPGGTTTVDVLLDNEDPISSLQFDMILPEGISFTEYTTDVLGNATKIPATSSYTRNSARLIANGGHSLTLQPSTVTLEDGKTVDAVRCVILEIAEAAKSAIKQNEGPLFSMSLKAVSYFKAGEIVITELAAVDNTKGTYDAVEVIGSTASVSANVANFSLEPNNIELNNDEVKTITFSLNNSVVLSGLEAKIVIPEGLEIVETDDALFKASDRLSVNTSIASNPVEGGYKIAISAMATDTFDGTEGALFSFNVRGTKAEKYEAKIKFENVIVSTHTNSNHNVSYKVSVAEEGADEVTVAVSAVPGDANADGEVDITDVQTVVKAINEGSTETVLYDINGDGEIDVTDVIMLISIINKQ